MDRHTLEKLEFSRIRDLVGSFARSPLGRDLAGKIEPTHSVRLVRRWLGQVREMAAVAETLGLPPVGGVRDVRANVRRAAPPTKLEPEELCELSSTLRAVHEVVFWVSQLPESARQLRHVGERIGDYVAVADAIDRAIDTRGRVRDEASERLARIRQAISEARAELDGVFRRLLRDPGVLRLLQYPGATFHNDRRVLPVKVEYRGRVPGIIHRSSDSGATVFVEPSEAVELNNTIVRLQMEEQEEIGRILWGLTRLVHMNADGILAALNGVAVLDLIAAKYRMAKTWGMHVAEISVGRPLRLRRARHPLLLILNQPDEPVEQAMQRVVPIDVRLGDDFDVLVVTGPNTGGKTVALKTVGLAALMHQAGLPVPADEGSVLPVFRDVMIDIGDEQSLEQSLSTFSSHLKHILRTLQRAGPDCLVLIDELGAGTDPEEGAAIGRAILEELRQRGTLTMISTHLGALKSAAYSLERVENASVQFDVRTLSPTYELRIGEPGESNALVIAQRLGMPRRLVQQARGYLSDGYRAVRDAIAGTVRSRREAEEARREAEELAVQARRREQQYEAKLAELEKERAAFEAWRRRVASLRPGDEVFVKRFGRSATVVRMKLHKQLAVVAFGAIEAEVPLAEIVPDLPGEGGPARAG